MYAKVSGYIQKLYVDWGTHVKQGQLLAVLEIPELQQQLQQDEATVHRSEQDLARAREELNRAQSAYNVAHLTYTRLADVQKSRPELVAQQEIDVAQGKDLEAERRRFRARRTRWPRPSRLARRQGRARKGQGHVRLRAHHRAVRRRGHRDLRLHRRAASRGNFLEQGRLGALPAFAKQSSAPGDSRAGKGRAGYSHGRNRRRQGLRR